MICFELPMNVSSKQIIKKEMMEPNVLKLSQPLLSQSFVQQEIRISHIVIPSSFSFLNQTSVYDIDLTPRLCYGNMITRVSGLKKTPQSNGLWHTELSSSRGVPKCGVHVYNWPGSDVLRTFKAPPRKKHLRSVKAKTYGHPKTSSDSLSTGDLTYQ